MMKTAPSVLLLAAATLLSACVTPRPPTQYQTPWEVSTACVADVGTHIGAPTLAPDGLRAEVQGALESRQLESREIDLAASPELFAGSLDTSRRFRRLAEVSDTSAVLVLVETRAVFYSLLSGAYRWTVYAKITVGDPSSRQDAMERSLDLAAILPYAHLKDRAAIEAVSPIIARKVGQLVDEYLEGRPTGPAAQAEAPAAEPSTPAPSPAREDESVYLIMVDRYANGDPSNDVAVDTADAAAWHGGDLRGILDRVDDLHALGVRTLWLTPIFKTRTADFMGHGAFHGYWVEDIGAIDPRFGDKETLQALTDALHARGMRLILDLVVNHVGYEAPVLTERPDWFHAEGTIEDWDDPVQLVRREVHGLPDLAQENPEVYDHLLAAAKQWIETTQIDGFRLDAVKHVSLDFWSRYNAELLETRPDLMLLGEMFDGSVKKVDKVYREGRFTHLFDFPTAFALQDVFCRARPPGRLAAILSNDRLYSHPEKLVTFLDNHDTPRIRSLCKGDGAKVRQALTAQLALRGVPSVTYGTEAGLSGVEEPHNRPDMVFSPEDGGQMRDHLSRLLKLRREHAALRSGQTHLLMVDEASFAFARVLAEEAFIAIVHTGSEARTFDFPAFAGASISDALSGAPLDAAQVSPGQTALLRVEAPGQDLSARFVAGSRTVEFVLRGASPADSDTVALVGSGPEVGAWDPSLALVLKASEDGYRARIELPINLAFAFKIIIRDANKEVLWEPGEDRIIFVSPGDGAMTVDLKPRRDQG